MKRYVEFSFINLTIYLLHEISLVMEKHLIIRFLVGSQRETCPYISSLPSICIDVPEQETLSDSFCAEVFYGDRPTSTFRCSVDLSINFLE